MRNSWLLVLLATLWLFLPASGQDRSSLSDPVRVLPVRFNDHIQRKIDIQLSTQVQAFIWQRKERIKASLAGYTYLPAGLRRSSG